MSPEQLRGERIDHRSDIWAFGCLLFEVLAGSPAFPGRTRFDRVAATLDRPPEWGALPEGTPERLRRLIAHCLDKDADRRLGSMSQARRIVEDEAVAARGVVPIVPQAPGPEEHPTNLPLQLKTFIGREGPMAELSQRLERTRLVTVVGAGGCGKSRLCIEVGLALVPRFAGGVWLVELAPIAESGRVPQAVAQALARRVANLESYIGLVEVGVDLIPAGGGRKEGALRAAAAAQAAGQTDVFPFVRNWFMNAAMANVSKSALEARAMGYLLASDLIVFNSHELLWTAIGEAFAMGATGYLPPLKVKGFPVAGRSGVATIKGQLVNMRDGGFISAHDMQLATFIAEVLCGGDVEAGALVDEQWLLDLERKLFMQLVAHPKSQERMMGMLQTGKPVRN